MPAILEYNPLTYNHINFLGRITQKSWAGGETTTYSYDPSSELVTRISSPGATQYFTYDSLYRISTTVDSIDNNSYSASYSYNQKGDIDTILYNSAVSVTNIYNNFGYLDEVKVNTQSVWNANTMNRYGIIDNFTLGNQATTSLGYDTNGLIDSILTVRNGTYLQRWNYEKEVDSTGNVRELYYISCSAGLVAILQRMNNQDTIFYIHTDHLGSFDVVTTQNGIIRERYNFDPWGRRRNPYDWSYNNISTTFLFDRGFTGHEHLDKFALINMNGRVYDPLLAMFLSPDNYLQEHDFTQNFNRYGYCLNNPLKYFDPSGYTWWSHFTGWVGGNWDKIVTGAYLAASAVVSIIAPPVGVAMFGAYVGGSLANGGELNICAWDYKDPMTYVGIAAGGLLGYAAGYEIANGMMTVKAGIGTGLGTIGMTYGTTNGFESINWTTVAGGSGEIPFGNKEELNSINLTVERPRWNGSYFQGTEDEANEMAIETSKFFNVEIGYFGTSKGYYFDQISGDAFGIKYDPMTFNVSDYNSNMGYNENTISGTYRYTYLENIEGSLYLGPNIFQRSRVYYSAHTHPGNNRPRGADLLDSKLLGIPEIIVGWNGVIFRYGGYGYWK